MLYCVFKKSLLIASLLILSSINNIWGQVGKEFWFAIPKETSGHSDISASNNVSFKITNQDTILPTHVTISMPAPGSGFTTREIDIAPGSTYVEIVATSDQNFANVYANPAAWDAEPIPGKTKHGVLITSTQDITVYYDYDNPNNRDLFSLKGKNALGTKFYLPFQNIWGKDGYNPDALSTSDIVATEDGTTITITPTVILKGRTDLSTFTVTLNKGETYSIVARSCNASDHFTGTYVSSDKPIAVTVNDDSTPVEGQGCYDIIGDQIIPVSVCGLEYIVMTGSKSTTNGSNVIQDKYKGEQIFVVGTAAGTKVEFFDKNGVSLYSTTVNAGGSTYISPNITNNAQTSIYIKATQPIYVLHITGIGCEMGGAIVPPITNCTGSYEVSFYRSSVGGSNSGVITLNLMIRYDTTQPFTSATQSHYHFTVYHQDGSTFNIPGTWFEPIANTGWAVLSKDFRGDVGGIGDYIFRDQPTKIVNDYDVFHLGITNGVDGNTNKYGYFSSFSAVTAGIATIGTGGSNSVPAKSHIYCYGDTVYIQATGGSGYSWHLGSPTGPKTYIANPQKGTTQVYCPPGTWSFYCIIDQAKCFGDDTLKVTVDVIPEVRVMFDAGTAAACSPFKSTITNKSIGATDYAWSYKINNGSYQVFTPPSQTSFIQPASGYFENTVSPYKPIIYTYRLLASYKGECPDSTSRQIVVYPIINANFLPTDTTSCHPALVPFRNLSNGNVVDSMYQWEFGDGNSAPDVNPIHTYKNQFGKKDTTYNVTLIARSPYNCTDTARATVKVYPYLKANFTADTVRGCSPFTIHINNTSLNKQAISQYLWDFGDGITRTTANDTLVHKFPRNTGTSPIYYKVLLTVKHPYEDGCPDTISRMVTVYPESTISFIVAPNVNEVCDSTTLSFITTSSAAISGFEWDFDDGNTSKDKNPTHMFTNSTEYDQTYHVTLTGLTKEYCNAYASTDIKVHPFLDPRFTFEAPSNCAPFDATIKNQSRGGIESYKWTYGDFSSDNHSVADTTHLFRNTTRSVLPPTIRLVISNSGGACKDSVEKQILVYPEIKASFTPSSIIGCNPLPVTFTNKSTYPDEVSKHYAWDFGGDGTSDKRDEVHTFKNTDIKPAPYDVKLTVTSDQNCSDDTIITITVYPYVEAKFTVDTVKGCSPFNVNISNSSRGLVTAYQWLYDDGAFDQHSSASYSHTYFNNLSNNPLNGPLTRKLFLIASNTNDLCKSRDSIDITVYPEVYSQFITDVIEGCNPLTVKYTNQSGPGKFTVSYDYKWEYGDEGTSATKDVTHTHTFENTTSKELPRETRLIATSMYKCTDTTKIVLKVYPFIDADFWYKKPDGCSPYSLTLNNSSLGGPNGYEWIFENGIKIPSNAPLLSHTFRNLDSKEKTFFPKLVASYNGQCQDTATEEVLVYPEVTAQFTENTLEGCHPLQVNMTNQSQNGDYYFWYYGDKGKAREYNTSHVYNNYSNVDSVYDLKLDVESMFGCTKSITKQVTVHPKPKPIIEILKSEDCPPFNVTITNKSEAGDFYNWEFGDNDKLMTTNLLPVTHPYDNTTDKNAVYYLTLTVMSVHNCTNVTTQPITVFPRVEADFTPDTVGCGPLTVLFKNKSLRASTYEWVFGNTFSSKLKDGSSKFENKSFKDTTYRVRMIGYSDHGCSDTAYRNVTVYPQPLAGFDASPRPLYYPDARINLDNQTNDGIWNYLWDFGDKQTSDEAEPGSHEYLHWGVFDLSLTAWNDNCRDSVTQSITVNAPNTIADFDASDNGCVPLTVNFTNHSTWATSYKWDFDDGGTSTDTHASHVYDTPGKYQVKLITYGDGAKDETTRDIEVYPKPEVKFNLSPRAPEEVMLPDALVQYYNTSKLGDRYRWDFGDGDTSSVFEPTHTYKELGIYDVTLNVWTEHLCFDSVTLQDAVIVQGKGLLVFPNAFTPGTDGPNGGDYKLEDKRNDIFYPYHDGVEEYKLEIYDRWGELLFESSNVNVGWDGYYKGNLCKSDVYIWKAKGKFYNGSSFNKAGDVTLLR